MCCSPGIAQSAHFRRVAGILVQQGQIGVEEESVQIMLVIPYVLLSDHGWLQVVALFNSRVCGQPFHRASATVRTQRNPFAEKLGKLLVFEKFKYVLVLLEDDSDSTKAFPW